MKDEFCLKDQHAERYVLDTMFNIKQYIAKASESFRVYYFPQSPRNALYLAQGELQTGVMLLCDFAEQKQA